MITLLSKTTNHLTESVRGRVVKLLNQELADAIDLHLQVKQANWNITGPCFIALRLLCDQIARQVDEAADEIADRVAQLGGAPLGTGQSVVGASRLSAYPLHLATSDEHMTALKHALATFAASVETTAEAACAENDLDTAEVLVEISRNAERLLAMLDSYLRRLRPEMDESGILRSRAADADEESAWLDAGRTWGERRWLAGENAL